MFVNVNNGGSWLNGRCTIMSIITCTCMYGNIILKLNTSINLLQDTTVSVPLTKRYAEKYVLREIPSISSQLYQNIDFWRQSTC